MTGLRFRQSSLYRYKLAYSYTDELMAFVYVRRGITPYGNENFSFKFRETAEERLDCRPVYVVLL